MKLDKDKAVFLLGGHDLEMQTIRELLQEDDYIFFDESQKWGAKLGAYKDRFKEHHKKTFYAIELEVDKNDKELLQTYDIEIIDHHGDEHNGKPASILQVLDLLGVKKEDISREQELIAANDAQYIKGMECLHKATECEIISIRQRDREAQGIKYTDELAGKNDARSKKIENSIVIVCATTPYFSTITDSLYFDEDWKDKSIIYNEEKIVFYGFPRIKLQQLCEKYNIEEDDYYFGGDNGYFGIKDNCISKEVKNKMKKEMIEKYEEKVLPYSSHIFMFPFRFDYIEKKNDYKREYEFYKEEHIDKRINIKELLNQLHKNDNWSYEAFNLDEVLEEKEVKYYNEFSYFYDYAKEALYNLCPFPTTDDDMFYKNEISYYFEHKYFHSDKVNNRFKINYKKCDINKCYDLQIDGISLRIFQTGIAVLSLEIENYNYHILEDIKNINEFGRRFYPQYLINNNDIISNPEFLAQSMEITSTKIKIVEDFKHNEVCIDNTNQIKIGKHITKLLGKNFTQNVKKVNSFYIQPIMDDRMFVMCWYGNNDFVNRIQKDDTYTNDDSWYEYIFVDKHDDVTVQNDWMKNELIYNATYDRWSKWKTFYGVTRYSFVALTNEEWFGKNGIRIHMNTMYFQMMLLLLVTRASILRFSDEVSAIASLGDSDSVKRLGSLYEKYLRFYNRIYFKEVTHQDQGIELYDMALKQMKIPEHMEKLDGKFTKLFEYARIKEEEKQNKELIDQSNLEKEIDEKRTKEMNNLTRLGAYILIPSLVIAIIGLEDIKKLIETCNYCSVLLVVLSFVFSAFIVGDLSRKKEVKDDKSK